MIKMSVIGNLGKDAVIASVNGVKVINFTMAVNEIYVDQDAVIHEETRWINCAMWRKKEQSCEIVKYLKSGIKVYVSGRPGVELYKKANGEINSILTIKVRDIELLTKKEEKKEESTDGK